jgi:osmotically-inducible protein OsmY
MKSNSELQQDVQNAIKREPFMLFAEICLSAKKGVAALSGSVADYSKKVSHENAAKNVIAVKTIAEDIVIKYESAFYNNDTQIAENVLRAWKTNRKVPAKKSNLEDFWGHMVADIN